MTTFCDTCGLPAAPHADADCFEELKRKYKCGDELFDSALALLSKMKDYEADPKYEPIRNELLRLDLASWRWAV